MCKFISDWIQFVTFLKYKRKTSQIELYVNPSLSLNRCPLVRIKFIPDERDRIDTSRAVSTCSPCIFHTRDQTIMAHRSEMEIEIVTYVWAFCNNSSLVRGPALHHKWSIMFSRAQQSCSLFSRRLLNNHPVVRYLGWFVLAI